MNPLKRMTFAHAERTLAAIPAHCHVCIMVRQPSRNQTHSSIALTDCLASGSACPQALFHDRKAEWVVSSTEIQALGADRANTSHLEASNVTNYGLQVLYGFLELPFLSLQVFFCAPRLRVNAHSLFECCISVVF